jgi:hypothetical protein
MLTSAALLPWPRPTVSDCAEPMIGHVRGRTASVNVARVEDGTSLVAR